MGMSNRIDKVNISDDFQVSLLAIVNPIALYQMVKR